MEPKTPEIARDLHGRAWTSSWEPDPNRASPPGTPLPQGQSIEEAIVAGRLVAQEQARRGHLHQARQ